MSPYFTSLCSYGRLRPQWSAPPHTGDHGYLHVPGSSYCNHHYQSHPWCIAQFHPQRTNYREA
jgi:hypothetical protein